MHERTPYQNKFGAERPSAYALIRLTLNYETLSDTPTPLNLPSRKAGGETVGRGVCDFVIQSRLNNQTVHLARGLFKFWQKGKI